MNALNPSKLMRGLFDALTENWWAPLTRGIAAILFGVFVLAAPPIGLFSLVLAWGVYAIVDGFSSLFFVGRVSRSGASSGWYVFDGIIGILAGVGTLLYPGITAVALVLVIAARAIVTGAVEIGAALELRKRVSGVWMQALGGAASIAFGGLMITFPAAGALTLVGLIAGYAIFFGVMLCGWGFMLLRLRREARRGFAREATIRPWAHAAKT